MSLSKEEMVAYAGCSAILGLGLAMILGKHSDQQHQNPNEF